MAAGIGRREQHHVELPLEELVGAPVLDQAWIVLARSENRGGPMVYSPTHAPVNVWRLISRGVGVIGAASLARRAGWRTAR